MTPTPPAKDHPFYPDYNALVNFLQGHVQPPSLFYVTRDDVLQLTIAAPIVATTVQLSLRFMTAQGEVCPRFETFTVGPTGGTPVTKLLQNAEGYLLSASVLTPGVPRGQCFVSLAIKRGGGSADVTLGDILLQGYPGAVGGIAYPQSLITSSLEGRGRMRVVTVGNPAAGNDWSLPVPAGVTWILRSVFATLTTAVAVATRQVDLEITDATPTVILASYGGATEAASLADGYAWFNGAASSLEGTTISGGLPAEFRLPSGWIIKTVTAAIAAADQWSAIAVTVEEFIGG